MAVAHNGNIVNCDAIKSRLIREGHIFQSSIDSEVIAALINLYADEGIEKGVMRACAELVGAYALVVLADDKLVAVRDPMGLKPLCVGTLGGDIVFASETCAFDLLEAEYLREVLPGEMVVVDGDKVVSRPLNNAGKVPVRQCIFELVYFARPDSIVFGEDV